MKRRPYTLAAVLLFGSGLAACASAPPPIDQSQIAPLKNGYPLGPGDKLRVTVFNEPSLTGEYSVTSQGTIAFPLIGSVDATGLTTDTLSKAVEAKLEQGYLKAPRVSTEVLNFRPYYILGEVNKPGEYTFSNGLTIEQAVAAAGGFTYRANRKTVFLKRQSAGEKRVNLRMEAVQVLPGDTIRVGERYF